MDKDTRKPINIESHGVSPWHYFLESMSWGFSRAKNDDDKMAFLNVDSNLMDGGRGLEDILMADFLQSLSFAGDAFVNTILKKAGISAELRSCEIKGNAGNYYIPYEDLENGIRLAQPDGWIADKDSLILLEAKGYRKSASLNMGQLAKEYLIAQNVARHTGRKENFYVLLLLNKKEKIYKDGEKTLYDLAEDDFSRLWQANVGDLKKLCGTLEEQLKKEEDYESSMDVWGDLADNSYSKIKKHFGWITWADIAELAKQNKNQVTEQIIKAIHFHSSENAAEIEQPIFSKFLAKLAEKEVPLYLFYNGGCGNEILQDYEKEYLEAIGYTETSPWQEWHELKKLNADRLKKLEELEDCRRAALADLRQARKQIKTFYKQIVGIDRAPQTTRKAFEMLGESSQLESIGESCFTQRMKIKKAQFQEE